MSFVTGMSIGLWQVGQYSSPAPNNWRIIAGRSLVSCPRTCRVPDHKLRFQLIASPLLWRYVQGRRKYSGLHIIPASIWLPKSVLDIEHLQSLTNPPPSLKLVEHCNSCTWQQEQEQVQAQDYSSSNTIWKLISLEESGGEWCGEMPRVFAWVHHLIDWIYFN